MYVRTCVEGSFCSRSAVFAVVLSLSTTLVAQAEPVLRVAATSLCPVSLESVKLPTSERENLAVLGGAILTSVANTLLETGINWVKTSLDPSQNEFSDKRSLAMPGLFNGPDHNPKLSCLVVAIFDDAEPSRADFPLTTAPFKTIPQGGDFTENDAIAVRLEKVFPEVRYPKPLLYVELIRSFSPDGTAHYYEPVYAYVGQAIRPHYLSKAPVWEISIGWSDATQKAIGAWTVKFGGTPPLERRGRQLALLGSTWVPTQSPAKGAKIENSPFNMVVEVKEHRSPTEFAKALQKAADDNAAATRKLVQDAYPWRQQEVAMAAADATNKARDDARQKATTYLASLDVFKASCTGTITDSVKRARCGLDQVNLQQTYDAMKVDIDKYKLMPPGVDFPSPPAAP